MDRDELDRDELDRDELDRHQLDRDELDRHQLDLTTPAGSAGRSAADQAVDHLRVADRLPPGDVRRHASQRAAARLIAAHPEVLDHSALSPARHQLWAWARLVPFLLPDPLEDAAGERSRVAIGEQLDRLRELDDDPATAARTASAALLGLDSHDDAIRRTADRMAHRCAQRRAVVMADVLGGLAATHLADDAERGIDGWRTRFAIVNGTTNEAIRHLRDATGAATPMARRWWTTRSQLVGDRYSDRRVGLPGAPLSLADQIAGAVAGIVGGSSGMRAAARSAAATLSVGETNRAIVEADGRVSATVVARPTSRGALMVAHELGHAAHAHHAKGAVPPGALVGETVACWSSLVAGLHIADESAAMALAVGDMLVEELFVSAAVSTFEDRLYDSAAQGTVCAERLDSEWLDVHRSLWGPAVAVPDSVASGWARLPSLATTPGHACSYVWATVLALAMYATHESDPDGCISDAVAAGGIDADEFTRRLGFAGTEWVEVGLVELDAVLGRLAQRAVSGPWSPAPLGSQSRSAATTGS